MGERVVVSLNGPPTTTTTTRRTLVDSVRSEESLLGLEFVESERPLEGTTESSKDIERFQSRLIEIAIEASERKKNLFDDEGASKEWYERKSANANPTVDLVALAARNLSRGLVFMSHLVRVTSEAVARRIPFPSWSPEETYSLGEDELRNELGTFYEKVFVDDPVDILRELRKMSLDEVELVLENFWAFRNDGDRIDATDMEKNADDVVEPSVSSDPVKIRRTKRKLVVTGILVCVLTAAAVVMVVFGTVRAVKHDRKVTSNVDYPFPLFTRTPSSRPTNVNVNVPSVGPTDRPSGSPSFVPTSSPSVVPTSLPSVVPTTLEPSYVPTVRPSSLPSLSPSFVSVPLVWSRVGTDMDGNAGDSLGRCVAVSHSCSGSLLWAGGLGVLEAYDGNDGGRFEPYDNDDDDDYNFPYSWVEDLALTEDGTVVVAGNPHDDRAVGVVSVFVRTNGTATASASAWESRNPLRGRASDDHFGSAVAVARKRDGTIVVAVGAEGGDYVERYQLANDDDDWILTEQTNSTEPGSSFGKSVVLARNGTVMVVGAPDAGANGRERSGSAFFYSDDRNVATNRRNGNGVGDRFGCDVASSSDGDVVAVGAKGDDNYVLVFHRPFDKDVFNFDVFVIKGTFGTRFGHAVALSADGNLLVVGAPDDDSKGQYRGTTFVFNIRNDDAPKVVGTFVGENRNDYSGHAVAVSRDGTRIAIGAHHNKDAGPYAGHVRLYESSSSSGKT